MKTYTLSNRFTFLILFVILTLSGVSVATNNVQAASVPLPPGDIGLPPRRMCASFGYAGTPYATGLNCRLVLVDGYPRTYVVFVPPNVQASAPVVFLFHGSNGNGAGYLRNSGWLNKARQEGLVLVSGSGLKYCLTGSSCENGGSDGWESKWHHYHLPMLVEPPDVYDYNIDIRLPGYPPPPAPWPADDVKFTEAMMDDVSADDNGLDVDSERFYASGFSSGAAFSARLAIELPERLTAVGYSSAGLIDVSDPPQPDALIPVLALIGTHEPGIMQVANGGTEPVPLDPDEFLAIESLMSYFVIPHLDGFRHHYAPGSLTPVEILEGDHYTLYRWQTGTTDHIFQLGVLEGLRHTPPNGCDIGNPYGFVAPDIFWDFFQSAPDYSFTPITASPPCPWPS